MGLYINYNKMKLIRNSTNYKSAGVDIDAGNKLVDLIKPLAKATSRKGADVELGGFGGLFDIKKLGYKDPVLVSGTDGVGTKLKLAQTMEKHDTIGIDLVAMSVNDIVVQGAEPLFFLDYFACGKLDNQIAYSVIKGIATGCKDAGAALIGGETAEMPGMYKEGEYDLAGFAVGVVERAKILPKKDIKSGDVVIGIASSGFHSNGYSLVRHVLDEHNISLDKKPTFSNATVGDLLLEPTRIYVKTCLEIIKNTKVKGFAHITGGGLLENIHRVLPNNLVAEIDCASWKMPEIFKWVGNMGGIENLEMLRTFNCGIGMIAIVPKSEIKKVSEIAKNNRDRCFVIGKIIGRKKNHLSTHFVNLEKLGE